MATMTASAGRGDGREFERQAMPYLDSLYNTAYRMTRNSEPALETGSGPAAAGFP
jgi:hypothetical protein